MDKPADNLTWHEQSVSREMRTALKGHRGALLWFTGLSGSGKSTIANAVDVKLHARGIHTYLLDGDNVRLGLNANLGFSAADREENVRRIGEVGKLLVDAGLIVSAAFISPYRRDRDRVRELLVPPHFVEVYVNASLATCEARDPKDLYKKARAGEIKGFTGIDDPYEAPQNPELELNGERYGVDELSQQVVNYLHDTGLLSSA